MAAQWPEAGAVNHRLLEESKYITHILHELRVRIKKHVDMTGKVSETYSLVWSPISDIHFFFHLEISYRGNCDARVWCDLCGTGVSSLAAYHPHHT